jgi:acyl-CoA reductase-like NAD-dependent aldehyde dehydrogenase
MYDVNLLIGGKPQAAIGGATFERRNPVSGNVVTRAAAASVDDALAAVAAAQAAFPTWSAQGPGARRAKLNKAADLLEARAAEFAAAVRDETGSTAGWGHFNVHFAASMLREAASMTTQVSGEVVPSDVPGNLAMAHRQPVGVVFGIAPWNAPVILGVRAIAMPLACGNTVVFKSSEVCPQTHQLIGQTLIEAGLGDGVINVLHTDIKEAGTVSEAVIAHPAVKRVNFTGSTRVGKLLAQVAAKYLKPILLELGGKAPLVVLEDADLDAAVNATVFGAYANAGQICMSTERVIIDAKVADDFAARLTKRVAALPVGNPLEGEFVIGSVVGKPTIDRLQRLVGEAVKQGAKVLTGGDLAPVAGNGTVVKGVVVDHVTPAMALFREESFAPQVSITRVKDADEAITLANDTEYGLSAAIFTRDIARGLALAKRIDSGICHINGPTVADEAQMPFGGVKGSGYGRFGGKAGVDAFTELRWITVQTTPRHYPF